MNPNNKKNEEIGERLVYLRKALEINQGELAKKLGYSSGNGLSMMEKGKTPLREHHCLILQTFFNVNIEWLKTGRGEMFLSENNNNALNQINMSVKRKEEQIRADRIIGEKLRKYRVLNKISQREVAQLWKVQPNSISGYEAGALCFQRTFKAWC